MEGKASQSGTVSGPAAAKREVRRMIRERVGGLDAAAREAMSRFRVTTLFRSGVSLGIAAYNGVS